jgi:Transposase DDE domain
VATAAANAKSPLAESQLHNWKLLQQFQRHLAPRLARAGASAAADHQLTASDYLSLQLFALLNPALKSARSLCVASRFERVQREVCPQPVKLASFSEMQHVCDPELLAGLLRDLAAQALPTFGDARLRAQVGELIANDGTLLPALPRMAWALWQNPQNRAGKLHLEFSVWRQVPAEWTVTPSNTCERLVWKTKLKRGVCYVNDRNYSHDYRLIQAVQQRGASFVLRLHNNAVVEKLAPARPLCLADRQAGVVEDVRIRLGASSDGPVGRLVRVEADGHVFLLFTDREDLAAELVALIYRYRWQIELFFKWIKCILGCRHWLAESQAGVTLQIYCALIASVLLVLWTGRKPTLRQWEALQLYWLGWVSLEELSAALAPKKKSA